MAVNCPDCKQAALTKITGPQNQNNPNRAYYICDRCPGKDGKGTKFLGWVDGKNQMNPENNYKKRKLEDGTVSSSESSIDEKLDSLIKKIDEIHEKLRLLSPPLPPSFRKPTTEERLFEMGNDPLFI